MEKEGVAEIVRASLAWLARHQAEDGSWSPDGVVARCGRTDGFSGTCDPNPGWKEHREGLTGLALLAFLGAGVAPGEAADAAVVRKGIEFLVRRMNRSGQIGERKEKLMYDHLIATCALIEAAAMGGPHREEARRAFDFALEARNEGAGWRYSPRSGETDTSVTGWGAEVVMLGELMGWDPGESTKRDILAWFERATDATTHRTGYRDSRPVKVVLEKVNEVYADHPTLTAIATLTRVRQGDGKAARVHSAVEMICEDSPAAGARGLGLDFYYWHWAAAALFEQQGIEGKAWKEWYGELAKLLRARQNVEAGTCRHGSWEPVDRWSAVGGRVYVTAMGALALLTPCRYGK